MEVVNNENLVVDRIAYRTRCKFCDIKIELNGEDLTPGSYPGSVQWRCPICGFRQSVFFPKLKSDKVIYYKTKEE